MSGRGSTGAGVACALTLLACATTARADPPWIERRLTLAAGEVGVGAGVGIADDAQAQVTGTGLYVQLGYGITQHIELLVRDGFGIGLYGEYARAQQYGRLYTTDGSVVAGTGAFSNPDLVALFRLVDLGWLEIGAEAEAGFPVERDTDFDDTVGLLATLHYAPWLRFDAGAFFELAYSSPVEPSFEATGQLWFGTGSVPVWFGPVAAISVTQSCSFPGPCTGPVAVPLGAGIGYSLGPDIDLRAQWLVPKLSTAPGTKDMGFGIGFEWRIPAPPLVRREARTE